MNTHASAYFAQEKSRIIATWQTLLRFKSISPDKSYKQELVNCAEWLKTYLEQLGFVVDLIATEKGNPLLIADRAGDVSKPKVVIYNHYDVQPAAKEDGWLTEPFEPILKNNRMYARGACDNKGQFMYVLASIEYLIKNNKLDFPLTLLLEGDEECGSAPLLEALNKIKNRISADVFIIADLGCLALEQPVVTCGVRGHLSAEISLVGAPKDLHSGVHGGVAPNPAFILSKIIAEAADEFGIPKAKELLAGTEKIDQATLQQIKKIPFSTAWYENKVNVKPLMPPMGMTTWERVSLYPCFELTGFVSGHYSEGVRNIIPSKATAKVGLRIGPSQDVQEIAKAFEEYFKKQELFGCNLLIKMHAAAPGGLVSPAVPAVALAKEVLDELSGGKAGFHWEGATIPIVGPLKATTGSDPVMIGFCLEEDAIHANNESFGLHQLEYGFNFMVRYLEQVAQLKKLSKI